MKNLTGYCERCENFSPFLGKLEKKWLCTVCRDRMSEMQKMIIPA